MSVHPTVGVTRRSSGIFTRFAEQCPQCWFGQGPQGLISFAYSPRVFKFEEVHPEVAGSNGCADWFLEAPLRRQWSAHKSLEKWLNGFGVGLVGVAPDLVGDHFDVVSAVRQPDQRLAFFGGRDVGEIASGEEQRVDVVRVALAWGCVIKALDRPQRIGCLAGELELAEVSDPLSETGELQPEDLRRTDTSCGQAVDQFLGGLDPLILRIGPAETARLVHQ